MKVIRQFAVFAALLFPMFALSCSKEGKDSAENTTKVSISLGRYYSAKGTVFMPTWTGGAEAGAADVKTGAVATGKALGSGESTAIFLFKLKNAATGDGLVCWYPQKAAEFADGKISFAIDARQKGTEQVPFQAGAGKVAASSYTGAEVQLKTVPCVLLATIQRGAYSIVKIEMKADGGEKLAGACSMDPSTQEVTATESAIRVEPSPIDCRNSNQVVPIYVAPGKLSKGFTLTFTTDKGNTFSVSKTDCTELPAGGKVETDPAAASARKLIACGSQMVYLFDAASAREAGSYSGSVLWSWDSSKFPFGKATDHIDECKVVDDGKKFLITCSNNNTWCAVVNYPAGDVAYSVTNATNAHSAELLPGNKLVVACSDPNDCINLYDMTNGSTSVVASYPLSKAHGVVWCEKKQRLYAIGLTSLQVYRLSNWDSSSPALVLEKTLSTTGYVSGLHDMTMVNEETLIMAGSNSGGHSAALFNVNTEAFTAVPHFNGITGMKSINYNMDTGEVYYTYAAAGTAEGAYDWSSHKIRYTDDITKVASGDGTGSSNWSYIKVEDINMYKVRVYNW